MFQHFFLTFPFYSQFTKVFYYQNTYLGCKVYGFLGGVFGTCSIMTMVLIGYDRYNIIVKGLSGTRITSCMASYLLLLIWTYSILICIGPFFGWGNYKAEGLVITCSYDFLSTGVNERTFVLFAFLFNYFIPMLFICVYYYYIVKAVVAHEAALRLVFTKSVVFNDHMYIGW